MFIHIIADTSWVPVLGQACVGDHPRQEAWPRALGSSHQRGTSRIEWGVGQGASAVFKKESNSPCGMEHRVGRGNKWVRS